jgi:hypothetical protein
MGAPRFSCNKRMLPLEPRGMNIETELSPLAVTFSTAKKITGLGLTTLWKLAKEGRVEVVRVGRRTLITFCSLQALLTPGGHPQSHRRGRPRKQAT